ncbi:MAG: restriction endonuclease subunit S [Acutalibacteraceae bacterium]
MKYKTYKIKDLISEISMGPFGSNIKVKCFVESGIPVLNGSNLTGFVLNDNSFRYVTTEKADSLGKANAYRGDVVITHRGTLGQIVFIPEDSKYNRYVISQSQFRVKCNEKILPEYLVYYFHTNAGQHKLLSNASQVGVPALARASTTFQTLDIDIPDVAEQRKIVDLLETIRGKIELNNAINNNLEQQAQAIYQKMFVDNPSSEWEEGTLSDIADITMGQSPIGSSYNEEMIGTIFFQGRAEFGFRFPTVRLFTTEPKRMACANDTLMSVRAPVGDLNVAHTDCCIGRGLAAIHSKTNHQSFVLYTMFSLKKQLEVFNGEGTVFGSINRNSLNEMPIHVPSDDKLDEFEEIVAPMDAVIRNNYDEICRLEQIRDSLLPKLMSGELDVSDIEL